MDTTQQQFDQAYWASQPPEVQALPGITDPDQRAARAATLATNGFTIDVPIMVWGWDAYLVMTMRAPVRLYLGAFGAAAAGDHCARYRAARRGSVRSGCTRRPGPFSCPLTLRTIRLYAGVCARAANTS